MVVFNREGFGCVFQDVQDAWFSYTCKVDSMISNALKVSIKITLQVFDRAVNGDGKNNIGPFLKVKVKKKNNNNNMTTTTLTTTTTILTTTTAKTSTTQKQPQQQHQLQQQQQQ